MIHPKPDPSLPALWALIPCAGSGSRAGTTLPKQYQWVGSRPMVGHTLEAFAQIAAIRATVVVLAPDDTEFEALALAGAWQVARCGGTTRAQSVANGLAWLENIGAAETDWVLVHDAARCLITPQRIQSLIDVCLSDAVGGLLAHALPDTLKQEQGPGPVRVATTVDRRGKWLAQTPQMFRMGALRHALTVAGDGVTDESSAMEAMGCSPLLVEGGAFNFKVTYADDFELAAAVLERRERHSQQGLK